MLVVIAISSHREGHDAGGIPDHLKVRPVASGLVAAAEVNKGHWRRVGSRAVVEDGIGRRADAAAGCRPAGVVGIKRCVIAGLRHCHAAERGAASGVAVAVAQLRLGNAGQGGVGRRERRCRAQHQLVGIAGAVGPVRETLCGVVVQADRDRHGRYWGVALGCLRQ